MNGVPDELADLVHLAARTAPPHPAGLAGVHRRLRARRRRRAAGSVAGLAVLMALTGGTIPLLFPAGPPAQPAGAPATRANPTSTPAPATGAPAQRLMIVLDGGGVDEVRPDGRTLRHRLPRGWEQTVALPDGRLVGLQLTDLMPGTPRRDGPDVAGLSVKLVVLGPDDTVRSAREVRVAGQSVELLGADERSAYLARDAGIVTHDLATGRETMLLPSARAGVDLLSAAQTSVGRDRLAEQRGDEACHTDVRRLSDGVRTLRLTVDGLCENGLRLSPNGRLVAVPYRRYAVTPNGGEQRLAVFDTDNGTLRADQRIGTPRRSPTPGGIRGLAWADDTTVRVGWSATAASGPDVPVTVVTVRVQ